MIKALIGNGGHAKEAMVQMLDKNIVRFVDDNYWNNEDENLLPLSKFDPLKYEILVAVANSKDRYDIVHRLPANTRYFSFIHPTAMILDQNIEIGYGSFIGAFSILTTNIKIGKHAILNRGNHVGHDTVCGDFLSMMPGAIISGSCKISERVYLGTLSAIREKISICHDVIIGLNSSVVKDIEKAGVYVGTPARLL